MSEGIGNREQGTRIARGPRPAAGSPISALVTHHSALLALGALAVLAVVLGINLVSATNRLVTAYDALDRLEMELTEFRYTDPSTPIRTRFVVTNPTDQAVVVHEIELRVSAGVHPVGGNQVRQETDPEASTANTAEKYRLEPGETQAFQIDLNISDAEHLVRLGTEEIDWRVRGRIQAQADEDVKPEWIGFVVRYIPE